MRFALVFVVFASLSARLWAAEGSFAESLGGKLVKLDQNSGELRPYELEDAEQIKYFMIYFSAHWCAPCRKTTPALVHFYNETKAAHPEFEFILISGDRSEESMQHYVEWAQMPWPVAAWERRDEIAKSADLAPRSIPFMAMLDAQGRLLGASDLGGFNVGIPTLINGLQAELGTEVYDLQERHGKKSPFVLIIYAAAAIFFVYVVARRVFRKPG